MATEPPDALHALRPSLPNTLINAALFSAKTLKLELNSKLRIDILKKYFNILFEIIILGVMETVVVLMYLL